MEDVYIKEVMESMGWTDGSYIPFANEDNRKIMDRINNLAIKKSEKNTVLQNLTRRVENILSHYKNTEQDITENLKLLNAYRSEQNDELHMCKLAERDDSRLKQLTKELTKDLEAMKKIDDSTIDEVNKLKTKINKLTAKVNWYQHALSEWNKVMKKGEEANNLIEQFCKEDKVLATKLELKRRLTQDTISKQKKHLIEMDEERKSLEQAFDRTAQMYRQTHFERKQLINTWKEAVQQMNQRDTDIKDCEKQVESKKTQVKCKEKELKEQVEFLDQLLNNNKEIGIEIAELQRAATLLRSRLIDLNDTIALKENEVVITNKTIQAVAQNLQNQRQRNRQTDKNTTNKKEAIKAIELKLQNLEVRLNKFKNKNMSAVERLRQLDELYDNEERAKHQLAQEIASLDSILYRSQQNLFNNKNELTMLTVENSGIEIEISSLQKKNKFEENELQKRTEYAYNLGFQVQQLEKRLAVMEGTDVSIDPEKEERATVLEKENDKRAKDAKMLQDQLYKIEEEMRKVTKNYNKDNIEVEKISAELKTQTYENNGGEKQLKALTIVIQEKMVELSLHKMRMRQLEKQIAKHEDCTYTLERHKIELEGEIDERIIEIEGQRHLLFMKKKHLQEVKGTLKMDLAERQMKIDALKKRYDLAIELLGRNEDGTLITGAQLQIKSAQEKQLLLDEGNELNKNIFKAEEDIKAMENTLRLINFTNKTYKNGFEQGNDDDIIQNTLEEQQKAYCQTMLNLKVIRNNLNSKINEIEEAKVRREDLEKKLEIILTQRMETKQKLVKIHRELEDQKIKMSRAERDLRVVRKMVKDNCKFCDILPGFEMQLDLTELEERNISGLQQLGDLSEENYDLAPIICGMLYDKGLKIPQSVRPRVIKDNNTSFSEFKIGTISSRGSVCSSLSSLEPIHPSESPAISMISLDFTNHKTKSKKKSN